MSNTRQIFIPGDEWLYIKIYTGFKTADTILTKILPNLLVTLESEQIIDKWFFIRYSDPQFHLRVRFYINNHRQNLGFIISEFNKAIVQFVEHGLIWKIQLDTYQRELERYGPKTIEYAENIFHADSITIVKLLSILGNNQGDHIRWVVALKMIDKLLDDFNFDITRKYTLIKHLSDSFKTEFGFVQKEYKLQLDKKFRENRSAINEVLSDTSEQSDLLKPFYDIINQKSKLTRLQSNALLKLEAKGELQILLNSLLGSYIHMMINRLFRSKQRMIEMVLYNMLERYYSSEIAKNKYNSNQLKSTLANIN